VFQLAVKQALGMWLLKKDAIVQELNKLRETCAVHTDKSFVEFATQWQLFSESLVKVLFLKPASLVI
jgi:hypothetical protein